jgi:hypothetical protein
MSRLLSLVGTPSPKLNATLNIVRALAQTVLGRHIMVVANTLDVLREKFPDGEKRKGQPVVLMSDFPKSEMLETFGNLNAPIAICIDDFTTVAMFSVVTRGFGGVEAARFASMSLVNIEPLVVSPPPSTLFVGDPKVETVAGLAEKLAGLYELPMADDSLDRALTRLGLTGQGETLLSDYIEEKLASARNVEAEARATLARQSPLECELIDFLARHYDAVAQGRRLESLEWPVYSLLRPNFPKRMTVGPIDLTGPARHIYYGPYFALPAGAWNADLTLEVQDCLSDNEIAVDVFAGEPLAIVRTRLPPRGVYGCQIRFEIEDPSRQVEIRMQLLTGAIEGQIQLRRVRIRRLESLDVQDEEMDDATETTASVG